VPETPEFVVAAVAAPHRLAAQTGRDVLKEGGNAIEAMIAMAAAIAVVYPHMSGLGGDGFWLIRTAEGAARAILASGSAGAGATVAHYRAAGHDDVPARGALAALTVPGAVGGLSLAFQFSRALGGKTPLSELLSRAISLARDGAPVSVSEGRFDSLADAALIAAPGFRTAFLNEGKPFKPGEARRQLPLADTLDQLARAGLDDFYRGDIGRELAADLQRVGSPIVRQDLERYAAERREPLSLRFRDATLFNTPPPTQGLASLILLGLYQRLKPPEAGGFKHAHAIIEAAKRAQTIRDRVCVDVPSLWQGVPALLTPAALEAAAEAIDMARAAPWPLAEEQGGTVWMGAVDAEGNAVSYIQSVYWEFGSGIVSPATGVLMHNRGLAFSLDEKSPRALKPGRRPLHTLNPALAVFDDGRVAPYGSMGGDSQPQFQAQIFTRFAGGEPVAEAIAAPRLAFGRAWGAPSATVKLEASYDDETAEALARAGHETERLRPEQLEKLGHAGALIRFPNGAVAAAHDPRSDGGAAGF